MKQNQIMATVNYIVTKSSQICTLLYWILYTGVSAYDLGIKTMTRVYFIFTYTYCNLNNIYIFAILTKVDNFKTL